MLTIAYYFLQVILCSGIMIGYYWLVLRNKRFHQYNRFYLLAIALFSWMVPLIKIKWGRPPVSDDLQMFQFLSLVADNNTQIEESLIHKGFQWNVELLLGSLYIAFACIILFGMIRALFRIYRLLQMNSCENVGNIYLIMTKAKGTPFSFFQYIFWNEEIDIKTGAGKKILQHELTHVQQKHSYDKVFIQLLLILGWFNPFFWLLRKEMDMIHEFIADKKAVNNGDTATLAQMLLTTVYPHQQFALTHPFFFSPIKRRLHMLTNNKNPRFSYIRRLVVFPLLAFVVVLFAFRNKEEYKQQTLSLASVMETVAEKSKNILEAAKATIAPVKKDTVIFKADTVYIQDKDKNDVIKIVPVPTKYSLSNNVLMILDGKKVDNNILEMLNPNQIATVNVLKDASAVALYGEEAKSGVILVTTKRGNLPFPISVKTVPHTQNSNSSFQGNLSVTQLDKEATQKNLNGTIHSDTGIEKYTDTLIYLKDKNGNKSAQKPLVIIDGVKGDMNSVPANEIATINVWKGDSAIIKYGDEGKNGVVEINTKKISKVQGSPLEKNANSGSVVTVTNQPIGIRTGGTITAGTIKRIVGNTFEKTEYPVLITAQNAEGFNSFIKRNADVKNVYWLNTPLRLKVQLKDGTEETYDLTNSESKKRAENKYGVLPFAPPTPPSFPNNEQKQEFAQKQIPTEFPGGEAAWSKYLERNLNKEIVKTQGGPPGKYTVVVSFIIDKLGNLSEIEAMNDPGYGTKDEAIRMIVKGPKWKPATLNGQPVIFRQKQSISFNVTDPSVKISSKNTQLTASVPAPIVEESYDKVFTKVQIPAEFPGGQAAWLKFLQNNLNRDLPVEKGAPVGKYTDSLTFIVDKTGTISKVKSLNDPGFGTKEESLRVFAMMPKWKPALQNGRPVTSVHFKTITFVISEE